MVDKWWWGLDDDGSFSMIINKWDLIVMKCGSYSIMRKKLMVDREFRVQVWLSNLDPKLWLYGQFVFFL